MVIASKSLTFCIVTYKEVFHETITYRSLLNSIFNLTDEHEINISVFDNTPLTEKKYSLKNEVLIDRNVTTRYITDNNNIGLARAYNILVADAQKNGCEWIVLLDQDTTLPSDFCRIYFSLPSGILLHAPKVFSNSIMISPAKYNNYRSVLIDNDSSGVTPLANLSCINSGLLVNIKLYKKVGGYNEKLFLDFCDHDFILRVKKDYNEINIIDTHVSQNFSNDIHTKHEAFQRYKLFLNDLSNFGDGKNKLLIFFYVDLPRIISLSIKFKTLQFIKYRLLKNNHV